MPLVVAAGSILTTFLAVWGLTQITSISFIVQYLLTLIGLGVAIDYSLLIVTRWREERGRGADNTLAVERALATAGRSVLFSGTTVAVSLAALIALPVPFLRSVGITGLLIPLLSVLAALTLPPALLLVAGPRMEWPHRRSPNPTSRLWHGLGERIVRYRWLTAAGAALVLLALAVPIVGLHLGQPSNASLASTGGPAGSAMNQVDRSGVGAGLSQPIEILTRDPARVLAAINHVDGLGGVAAPAEWTHNGTAVLDAWTQADASSATGAHAASAIRAAAEHAGARVGGGPVQSADFNHAVYGNAWWILTIIVAVTFLLLARAALDRAAP
jgi:RND superfamily putative drug exporter